MEDAGKIAAIGRAQAVIEFNPTAPSSGPTTISSQPSAIRWPGDQRAKHHSMFVAASGSGTGSALSRVLGDVEPWANPQRGVQGLRQGRQENSGSSPRTTILDESGKAVQGGE